MHMARIVQTQFNDIKWRKSRIPPCINKMLPFFLSDHFSHRKRSRSKVKTQERKPEQTTPGSDPEEGGAAKPEVSN